MKTHPHFLGCEPLVVSKLPRDELLNPRIKKEEISKIILNGGHKMLSPERRFDAAILSNAYLFK